MFAITESLSTGNLQRRAALASEFVSDHCEEFHCCTPFMHPSDSEIPTLITDMNWSCVERLREYHERIDLQTMKSLRPRTMCLCIAASLLIWGCSNKSNDSKHEEVKKELAAAKSEIAKLKSENKRLEESIEPEGSLLIKLPKWQLVQPPDRRQLRIQMLDNRGFLVRGETMSESDLIKLLAKERIAHPRTIVELRCKGHIKFSEVLRIFDLIRIQMPEASLMLTK